MVKIGQSWDDKLIEDISNDFENFGKYFESIESFLQIEKKIIQNLADIPIKINDLKGDLLTRAEHYFEAVGKLKLTQLPEWNNIKNLQQIRNFITHQSEYVTQNVNWSKISPFIEQNPDLITSHHVDHIEFSEIFCQFVYVTIEGFIWSLFNQIKSYVKS